MTRRFTIAIAVVAAVTLSAFGTMQAGLAQPATDSGGRIVAAANAYLATLDPDQRAKARLDLNAKTRTIGRTANGHRDAGRRDRTKRPRSSAP